MVAMMGWGGVAEQGWRKGSWSREEDNLLSEYVSLHGEGRWGSVARSTGLKRSGKSCRLRWVNYLRPGLKRGHITPQEEDIIVELHALWGNKWSTIARYLPGRTDNEVKNFWRTHFKRKEKCTQKQEKRKAQILEAKQQQLEEDQNMKTRATPPPHQDLEACSRGIVNNMNNTDIHETQATRQENMEEDKYCMPKLMHQASVEFWSDLLGEGLYMGKLWNLDDVNGRMDPLQHTSLDQCNKVAMQINNQGSTAATLSTGGESSNISMHKLK
ncbi:hypothetical protein C1H46_030402 [Malus baccata]|uniref:Uncharacterized protein n=1 Tax=Malus baccata TaxID=106549 RepID=A0A540LCC7_MALBA|nr:hypothetical protein C1H46_030402 [Malus baccata]